eukprot:s4139_g8.t1
MTHYSTQVETRSPELETIKALRNLGAFCPPGEGLKSLESEASDKGAWIRFKYAAWKRTKTEFRHEGIRRNPFLSDVHKCGHDVRIVSFHIR